MNQRISRLHDRRRFHRGCGAGRDVRAAVDVGVSEAITRLSRRVLVDSRRVDIRSFPTQAGYGQSPMREDMCPMMQTSHHVCMLVPQQRTRSQHLRQCYFRLLEHTITAGAAVNGSAATFRLYQPHVLAGNSELSPRYPIRALASTMRTPASWRGLWSITIRHAFFLAHRQHVVMRH